MGGGSLTIPSIFLWFLFPVFGACFGSFFNVLIYRMPREMSIVRPASHCPICKHKILPWQNIPILSWLFLRGRCANCKKSISIGYPLVEFLAMLLGFIAAFLSEPNPWQTANLVRSISLFWLILTLVPIFAIDFKYLLLPDTVTIGGIAVGFVLSFFDGGIGWLNSLIGIVVCGGGLFLFSVISAKILKREGMGFGDVKLLASFGAIMGTELAFAALILGAMFALATIVPLRFLSKRDMSSPLPFGPFLGLAALVSYLFGYTIIDLLIVVP
ncbi:MAG: prepilin peptidase [Fibromonadaceae bacterium]|jgi:leader peptidase (prepilin peptidase)/N-methyltransferase|nr:prepilin peptidase [Fibromonadaceae bacterium]